MIWKNALKYPVLVIGLVLFVLFITDPKTKKYWEKSQRRFIPSTCDAVMDRVEPKAPNNWKFDCPGTQLLIINISSKDIKNAPNYRVLMYRSLANSLKKLAEYSNIETLEYLKNIEMILTHPKLTIKSKTDGQAVAGLIKLSDQADIARHLKLTVKVKEFVQD